MTAKFLEKIQTKGADRYQGKKIWSNKDLDPTPNEQRTWTKWDYVALWWGSAFNANNWSAGSSLISLGLGFSQCIGVAIVGAFLGALAIVGNARQGAVYRIGFPVSARSQFGVNGAYFFVFLRAIVAIVWFGIQSYYAGLLLSVSFRCIFGYKWMEMSPFPSSAGITSYNFTSFMLIHILQLPVMFVHPSHMRRAFEVKAVLLPLASIGMAVFCIVRAGGMSEFDIATKTSVSGSEFSWAWLTGINSIMGSISPMIINQPDLSRYSDKPSASGWPQGLATLSVKILLTFFSISSSAGLKVAYNQEEATWNLWDQLHLILDHEWSAGSRTAIFFVSTIFSFGTVLTNISANSIPFGADTTGLFPRYIDIRRGQILIWILGLAIVPWKFLTDAAKFITFLGSYTILMGAMLGVILCDFYAVRKGNIHLPSCYTGDKNGLYYFYRGVNWRACVAWVFGFGTILPGLVGAYDPSSVSPVIVRLYNTGWIYSVSVSAFLYLLFAKIFPVPVFPEEYSDIKINYEYLGKQTTPGVFNDEYWNGPGESFESMIETGRKEVESMDSH